VVEGLARCRDSPGHIGCLRFCDFEERLFGGRVDDSDGRIRAGLDPLTANEEAACVPYSLSGGDHVIHLNVSSLGGKAEPTGPTPIFACDSVILFLYTHPRALLCFLGLMPG
jgi:hypothetical protein